MEIAIDGIADPSVKEFLDYWNSLRGERFAPSWKEFKLQALDPKTISHIVVVDVHRDPLDFVFRFWGTAHVHTKGIDKTGKSLLEVPRFREASPVDEYSRVVNEKRPLAIQDMVKISNQDGVQLSQTSLRLPLSDDGKEVDKVISCVIWEDRRPS